MIIVPGMLTVANTRLEEVLQEGARLMDAGAPREALRVLARAMAGQGRAEPLLAAAANAWVAAVDAGQLPTDWSAGERDGFYRALILQDGCSATPPIFHHRIAAQHSAGVAGHLRRAAEALEPTLERLLGEGDVATRTVLLLLLLRDHLGRIDQARISELHRAHFPRFDAGALRIPYSVIFDRRHFRRNLLDLAAYVRNEGEELLDGSLPLYHILLLYWLVPNEFDRLPTDWSARAVRARGARAETGAEEAQAARSLVLRFDGDGHRALLTENTRPENRSLLEALESLASARQLLAESGGATDRRIAKLEERPRMVLSAAWNAAAGRFPRLARFRRKPKVAVCVSGQLRGFQRSWASWKPLLAGVNATVFVSSWQRIGRGTPEPFRSTLPFEGEAFGREYRAIGTELGIEGLRQHYPHLFAAFDRSGVTSEAELSAFYHTPHVQLDDEAEEPFGRYTNADKMYYKIERCFRMVEASGQRFDLILRIRPDKPVTAVAFDWPDMLAAVRSRPLLYCETTLGVHYGALLMGDQFALAAPETMRIYAETWSRAAELSRHDLYRFDREMTGHVSMAQICWLHGIDVRKVPVKFGAFQEGEPLAASTIREALAQDSAGRTEHFDQRLIAANAADLRGRR